MPLTQDLQASPSVAHFIATTSCMHLWDMQLNQQAALKELQQLSCSFLNGLVGVRMGA
jgi:hypothetical protein